MTSGKKHHGNKQDYNEEDVYSFLWILQPQLDFNFRPVLKNSKTLSLFLLGDSFSSVRII